MSEFISKSQAGQDQFVYSLLGGTGTFLDIGAGDPVDISNTYALEKVGWRGLCVDIGDVLDRYRASRTTPFVRADAITADFVKLTSFHSLGPEIDYLSFDIDEATLATVRAFPWDKLRFRVITIEHDRYRFGQPVADEMRSTLSKHGYTLLCKDVYNTPGLPYEDWWVDAAKVEPIALTAACEDCYGPGIKIKRPAAIPAWFDRIVLITLPRRADRWEHAKAELARCNIPLEAVTIFEGYDRPVYNNVPNGNVGCTASHRAVLELIAYHKWPRTLVFEDDFLSLYDDVNERFAEMITDLPDDWDLLYLGGHYSDAPIARVTPRLIRCGRMSTTSSYAITPAHARRMAPHISGPGPIDCLFSGFAADNRHYIFQPRLFAQYTSHSDLCDHTRDNVPCMTDTRHENMV